MVDPQHRNSAAANIHRDPIVKRSLRDGSAKDHFPDFFSTGAKSAHWKIYFKTLWG